MKSTVEIQTRYSQDREARRLLFICAQLKNGFFHDKGILLFKDSSPIETPELINVVLLTKTFELLQKDFNWKEFDADYWYRHYNTVDALGEFDSLCNIYPDDPPTVNWAESKVAKVAEVLTNLHGLSDLKVNIHLSRQGTKVSFIPNWSQEHTIDIYVRSDANISNVAYGIAGALELMHSSKDLRWEERQAIRHYLVYKTEVAQITGAVEPEPYVYSDLYQAYYQMSRENYAELGFPISDTLILEDSRVLLADLESVEFMSASEIGVLRLLVRNKQSIISAEELAQKLWGDESDEKFSLQAISKVIERIRKKLALNGIHKQVIFTKRGQGYVYFD